MFTFVSSGSAESPIPGERFRDCPVCPEMVVVPAGTFERGSSTSELGHSVEESPQHKVVLQKHFAMSIFEIKLSEWKACASEGVCTLDARNQEEGDSEFGWREWKRTRPVVGVSWHDAKRYAVWLSLKTGREYRLPSESEWEYAARGGVDSADFWEGKEGESCEHANLMQNKHCDDGYDLAAPVGSYRENAFGLHDMLGNVAEWVEDCWHDSYDGAPSDGSARIRASEIAQSEILEKYPDGDCSIKIYRGGHWGSSFKEARVSSRVGLEMEHNSDNIGLRIVRTLQ